MIPEFWTTRSEAYLAAILGESVELPAPRSRVEFYLAKVAGMDVEIPEPLTRIDEYLAEWAENGSGDNLVGSAIVGTAKAG